MDREVIRSSSKFINVIINVEGFQFTLKFSLLPVNGYIRAEWLWSLCTILWAFSKLTIQVFYKGENV